MIFEHKSVLLNETINSLNIKSDGIYVDGTLGGAGHALEVCKKLKNGKLIGIDQDEDAVKAATERLKDYKDRSIIVRDNYKNIKSVLENIGIDKVSGIYLDLGVSSYQLDTVSRGFTYREDTPLDMRMDTRKEFTAADIVNTYKEDELYRIIKDYGEDRFAKKIARNIVNAREKAEIKTTMQLVDIIKDSIPKRLQINYGHPAKRTFQALRIELNEELKVLEDTLDTMIDLLEEGGRLSVITFHSLEDRIVKNIFRRNENPCTCPKNFPVCVCGNISKGKVITRKAIIPSEEEITENKRSKSAKLRVFEKN